MEKDTLSGEDLESKLYFYRAKIISVYDGDSVTAVIDLGLHTCREVKIRLSYINAPEIRGESRPRGLVSRDELRSLILGKEVFIKTSLDKKDKYGRLLGEIWFTTDEVSFVSVNSLMVKSGFAVLY